VAEQAEPDQEFVVVGVSHRTGIAALRERLYLEETGQAELLQALSRAGIGQAVVLSTCDRMEIHAVDRAPDRAMDIILETIAAQTQTEMAEIAGQCYRHAGVPALRQLFAVAASLDSVVVGEPQVLGQVKESHHLAESQGMVGPQLAAALSAAYAAAKRVRSETVVGERPISIAAAAIQMARGVHGDLARRAALLLGGGEMGELMLAQLRQAGLTRITVIHPSLRRGTLIAHRLGGHVRPFEELPAALAETDILIAALGDDRANVTAAALEAALKVRRRRPMLCIDSAVPGDIDRAAERLDGVFLFDLGDLERLAIEGRSSRAAAAESAWTIVDAEVASFRAGQAARLTAPAVIALRRHFEAIRAEVLAEAGGADAATVTRLLVNRLLHAPSASLREMAEQATVDGSLDLMAIERFLGRLFGLAEPPADARRSADETDDKEMSR
jgi:glutamyl-tRNA reductase